MAARDDREIINEAMMGDGTGGTGRFVGIRGLLRAAGVFDSDAGMHESRHEGEY